MSKKTSSKIWVPPDSSYPLLPIRTRLQFLPLNELPWEIFQRLCARLSQRNGDVEHSQEYGLPGQGQEGIDIYVRKRSSGSYSVWQCKRYQEVKAADIKSAVNEFIKGEWLTKSKEFVICVAAKIEDRELADEIESQGQVLLTNSIALIPKGIIQLSEDLKQHPDLVDDYFGREWVREFCGHEAAERLSHRILNPNEVIRLRTLLRQCYLHHFETVDPGLPILTNTILKGPRPLPLTERFILPDILEPRQVTEVEVFSKNPQDKPTHRDQIESTIPPAQKVSTTDDPSRIKTTSIEVRRSAFEWIAEGDLSIIIGDPGIGKSTLLRYILLDLLNREPSYEPLAIKWGNRLPVWIPFPMWTRMVTESESGCSLSDVLRNWLLKVCAPTELITLVQQALADSRLLLFIDGLDEWSNGTAARTTVTLLEQFVDDRGVPAIASSRPLGFDRLGGLSSKWRRSKLAGFSKEQQYAFACCWFLHHSQTTNQQDSTPVIELQKLAENRAQQLVDDIQKDWRFAKLAEIPLLLSGLIILSVQSIHLPRSRFKAYEELTRLLLQDQPQRRERAAYARVPITTLSQENRERALASLAYKIHQSPESDNIDKTTARETLKDFFITTLHKESADGLELADKMLSVGTETVGILVEKSPQDIGFPHRAFQEFLTARHLGNLPFEEQKKLIISLFENPQWHDVLLCLCYLNTRTGEVDSLLDVIQNITLPPELFSARQSFLAEVAFGDLHCSAPVASRIAKETFNEIEIGAWAPIRKRLLEHALDGLFSDVLRSETEVRINQWYPDRHKYRSSVYQAMATWPKESETIEALWRGIFDEEESNQRVAAETLAKFCKGDVGILDRLLQVLSKPVEPYIATYILHALCLGWEKEPELVQLLQEARLSNVWRLRVMAIKHRISRQEHDSKDRDYLIQLAKGRSFDAWNWKEDAIEGIVKGWPNDSEIKNKALESLSSQWANEGPFDWDYAGPILLNGFPQDDEVALKIAEIFRREEYPQHRFGLFAQWNLLIKSFSGHRILSDAVDDWLEKKPERYYECEVALISKTERAKRFLLKPDPKTGFIDEHQVNCLIEGWGLKDQDVFQAIERKINSATASSIAYLLPLIIIDKKECRRRLLEWLKTENDFIASKALKGLINLGCDESDTEVVEAAGKLFANHVPLGVRWWDISTIIKHFPNHPRVREIALYQIANRGGEIGAVAFAYKDDLEIRHKIIQQINPLPTWLRIQIVDRLTRLAPEDEYSYKLLSCYDEDHEEEVKTKASIAYARSLIDRGDDQSILLVKLLEGFQATGPDMNGRIQAAFAALLEIGSLHIVTSINKSRHNVLQHRLGSYGKVNLALASQMGRHWDQIEKIYGELFLEQTGYVPDEFLEEIVLWKNNIEFTNKIIKSMIESHGRSISLAVLRLQSRLWSGTEQLKNLCLNLVLNYHLSNWVVTSPSILAGEILSEQFSHDVEIKNILKEVVKKVKDPTAIIIALSGEVANTTILQHFMKKEVYESLLLPARIQLSCVFDDSKRFVTRLSSVLIEFTGGIWDFQSLCNKLILIRLRQDKDLRDELFYQLEANPSSVAKLNFPQFLSRTDTRIDKLRNWCRKELHQKPSSEHLPEYALDIFAGRVRPINHILMEILIS